MNISVRRRGRPPIDPHIPRRRSALAVEALTKYYALTNELTTLAVGYAPSSQKNAGKGLKWLVDHDYAMARTIPSRNIRSQGEAVWYLLDRGITYAQRRGWDTSINRQRQPVQQDYFIKHLLNVNRLLIAGERFAATTAEVELLSRKHDLLWSRAPDRVTMPDGSIRDAHGDGLDALWAFGYDYRIWWEADGGTEDSPTKWAEKIAEIVGYALAHPDEPLLVAVVAMPPYPGDKRRTTLETLWRWTGEALSAMGQMQAAELFRLTDQTPIGGQEYAWFTTPHWIRPFDDQLYPLIDAPAGGEP
jgi:hypothetical protein